MTVADDPSRRLADQEATIRKAAAQYLQQSRTSVDARQTEIAVFSLVNRELTTAATPAQRIRALGRNHDLWSLLLKDLGQSGNRLPQSLRDELIRLAVWSMRYSIHANLLGLPIDPLVTVNTNILEGLKLQAASAAAQAAQAERPRALAV
jgi:flagellar protein FlaF